MREVAMTIHNQCRTMRYVITVYFEKHYIIVFTLWVNLLPSLRRICLQTDRVTDRPTSLRRRPQKKLLWGEI